MKLIYYLINYRYFIVFERSYQNTIDWSLHCFHPKNVRRSLNDDKNVPENQIRSTCWFDYHFIFCHNKFITSSILNWFDSRFVLNFSNINFLMQNWLFWIFFFLYSVRKRPESRNQNIFLNFFFAFNTKKKKKWIRQYWKRFNLNVYKNIALYVIACVFLLAWKRQPVTRYFVFFFFVFYAFHWFQFATLFHTCLRDCEQVTYGNVYCIRIHATMPMRRHTAHSFVLVFTLSKQLCEVNEIISFIVSIRNVCFTINIARQLKL